MSICSIIKFISSSIKLVETLIKFRLSRSVFNSSLSLAILISELGSIKKAIGKAFNTSDIIYPFYTSNARPPRKALISSWLLDEYISISDFFVAATARTLAQARNAIICSF